MATRLDETSVFGRLIDEGLLVQAPDNPNSYVWDIADEENSRLRVLDVIGILMQEIAKLQQAIADSDVLTWEGATFPNREGESDPS